MMWGTTRTLIANAITGQTTRFTLPVYLLGVGFRAALEPDPRRLPAKHQDVIAAGHAEDTARDETGVLAHRVCRRT